MPEEEQELDDQTGDAPADEVDVVALAGQVTELSRQISTTQGENESLKRQLDETKHNLEFYARRATEKPAPAAKDDDETDGEALVDMLAKPGGVKKFASVLKDELGLVTKADLDEREATITGRSAEMGQLAQDYPGLVDKNSDLFKTASPLFQKYQKQYPDVSQAVVYRLAAAEATAQLASSTKGKDEREEERQRRVAAQGGKLNTGRKGAPSQVIPEGSARMAAKLGLPAAEIGNAMKAHGHLIGEGRGA